MILSPPRISMFRSQLPPRSGGNLRRDASSQPLPARDGQTRHADVLILGAGCAGTSLAHHLEREGFGGKVVLLDSRRDFTREQRWCTWSPVPDSLQPVVSHSWNRWLVQDEQQAVISESSEYSYQEIYAPHFFQYFHKPWRDGTSPCDIQIFTGEAVGAVTERESDVVVSTCENKWRAPIIFDTRPSFSPQSAAPSRADIYLHQTFVGHVVEFSQPVFDASSVTLMDFRVPQRDGVRFMYVLPYSPTCALIESTSFAKTPLSFEHHAGLLRDYLTKFYGSSYRVRAQESGDLPMTTLMPQHNRNGRITPLGIAGGCARASSGYAFARIQRQTSKIAKILSSYKSIDDAKNEISPPVTSWKYSALDEVFLQALQRSPQFASDCFMRLFAQTSPDVLVRFLSERSSLCDDLQIIAAMPKFAFMGAALQRIGSRVGAQFSCD